MASFRIEDITKQWERKWRPPLVGAPTLLGVHRTANPDANAESNNKWALKTGKASWHSILEDGDGSGRPTVYEVVPANRLAWHIKEYRKAEGWGRAVTRENVVGRRGDIQVYGIETDEDWIDGKADWSDETRHLLVAYLVYLLVESERDDHGRFGKLLTPAEIKGHSEFDPWERPEDPDGLWEPAKIRAAVKSSLPSRMQSPPVAPVTAPDPNGPSLPALAAAVQDLSQRVAALEAA